jgi:small subunit ribosomal protein S11
LSNQENKAAAAATKKPGTRTKKKIVRNVPSGIVHIRATFNNTIVSITDLAGNVVSWASAGRANFIGSRKSSAFAAQVAAGNATKEAMALGMRDCEINVNGPGAGRESAIRAVCGAMQSGGGNVSLIRDNTPIPHNGCRARKRRRV